MSTILVVEDTQDSYDLIADALGDEHTLVHARTGPEGLDLAARVRPDLILLDMRLPELDGLSVVRRLRGMEELRAIPVVAVTANAMPQDRATCLAAGCDHYISKPIAIRDLVDLVNRIACADGGGRELRPNNPQLCEEASS
jgi:CheY-like chemotaxis protein